MCRLAAQVVHRDFDARGRLCLEGSATPRIPENGRRLVGKCFPAINERDTLALRTLLDDSM